MRNTPLSDEYVAHFAGHETFPLRQMWLKKAFDQALVDGTLPKTTFSEASAIAAFGVGKNMVASIRHWALACYLLEESSKGPYQITQIASKIFSDGGLDPYSENANTAWYVHWCLAGRGNRATTWYWLFNHVSSPTFSREELEQPLTEYARSLDAKRKLSKSTISRDIDTCIRSYSPRSTGGSPEDFAEPMLGELCLIYEGHKGQFSFRRGPKPTLHIGMFTYALLDFWESTAAGLSSLAFEAIAYGEGSPGRVFKLDEDSVAERLFELEKITNGYLTWTDSAGLRQVHKKTDTPIELKEKMIELAYV